MSFPDTLKLIKQFVAQNKARGGFGTDPKSVAGGIVYFALEAVDHTEAKKVWNLLNSNAGLSAGDDVYRLAYRILPLLNTGDRSERLVKSAALLVGLLKGTQPV